MNIHRASMVVIPAKAGIYNNLLKKYKTWIPAFAGMTDATLKPRQ